MILVVDDENQVRQFVAAVLQRGGYDVMEAAGADDALRVLGEAGPPKVLVTDIVMPGKNGIWLAAQFHRLYPGVPVLFVSGYAQNYQDELSGSVCLRKPFTPAELLAAVSDIIGTARKTGA